ncbi:unnamed protein product [Aspergillus oryzae]|uniref:Unnamed protein product n=1 Tax=Aspergillus oryzae TaxID=5062 RepID=A0AAN4YTA9_ASPOZ|nr:unnamed protein product [Aspergillus oryzae]
MTVKTLIQKPKPNLLRQFANFTRTTAGLEKTCRLIQSLAQLAIELDITPGSTTTAQWQTARSQIALTFKFWFYSLALSVIGAVWGLLSTSSSSASSKTGSDEKKNKKKNAEKTVSNTDDSQTKAQRTALMKRIVVDGCDLLIPGVFVGWMHVSDLMIGVTMVISTVVSGGDAWVKAQG